MDYIKIPVICEEAILALTVPERGRLLGSLLRYSQGSGEGAEEPRGNEYSLYLVIRAQMDRDMRDRKSAAERKRKSRESRDTAGHSVTSCDIAGHSVTLCDTPAPLSSPPTPPVSISPPPKEKPPNGGKEKGPVPGPDVWFERFWSAYPNHRCGKSSALKAWRKIKPSPALAEAIVAAVERQKGWEQWKRNGGQYIPMATTWLNQQRWDAEDSKPEEGEKIGYFRAPSLPPVGN